MIRFLCIILISLYFVAATTLVAYGAALVAQSPILGVVMFVLALSFFISGYILNKFIDHID